VDRGCRHLVFQPAGLDGVYSLFLGQLLLIRQRLLAADGWLQLCDVSPHAREVLDVFRLTALFDFATDEPLPSMWGRVRLAVSWCSARA